MITDYVNSKMPVMMGGDSVEITDTTNGFIDTGISSANYVILTAYTLTAGNQWVRMSCISGGNYRAQVINCVNGETKKSGSTRVYYWVIPR